MGFFSRITLKSLRSAERNGTLSTAQRMLTPKEQLIPLMMKQNFKIAREAVSTFQAQGSKLNAREIERLANSPHSLVHELILSQENIPERPLKILLTRGAPLVRDMAIEKFLSTKGFELSELFENPNAVLESAGCPELFIALLGYSTTNLKILEILTQKPETAEAAKRKIKNEFESQKDNWWQGRKILKSNPTKMALLELILKRSKRNAIRALTLLLKNNWLDAEDIEKLRQTPHQVIRKYLASYRETPQDILCEMINSPSLALPAFKNLVERGLAEESLFWSSYDNYYYNNEWIEIMVKSPSCPVEILEKIITQSNVKINHKKSALLNLAARDELTSDYHHNFFEHIKYLLAKTAEEEKALRKLFSIKEFVEPNAITDSLSPSLISIYQAPSSDRKFAIICFWINHRREGKVIAAGPLGVIEIFPSGKTKFLWARWWKWWYDPSSLEVGYTIKFNPRNGIMRIKERPGNFIASAKKLYIEDGSFPFFRFKI